VGLPPDLDKHLERPLRWTPTAALASRGALWERAAADLDDRVLARLVRTRLALDKKQGWIVLAVIAACVAVGGVAGTLLSSRVVLAATAAFVVGLAPGVWFYVDRALYARFVREGKHAGLSERACRKLFQRALGAEHMLEVLRSCGKEATDGDLAGFVR
jgi:hypothetical protein